MILISACLAGVNCKYDGGNNYKEKIFELVKSGKAILVCPEQLGGLSTPRVPAEIINGDNGRRVVTKTGEDVTHQYERGALEVLNLAKQLGIDKAILKANSPSCGCGTIYDGTFNNVKINGNGITSELLLNNGIYVITEKDELDEFIKNI